MRYSLPIVWKTKPRGRLDRLTNVGLQASCRVGILFPTQHIVGTEGTIRYVGRVCCRNYMELVHMVQGALLHSHKKLQLST